MRLQRIGGEQGYEVTVGWWRTELPGHNGLVENTVMRLQQIGGEQGYKVTMNDGAQNLNLKSMELTVNLTNSFPESADVQEETS